MNLARGWRGTTWLRNRALDWSRPFSTSSALGLDASNSSSTHRPFYVAKVNPNRKRIIKSSNNRGIKSHVKADSLAKALAKEPRKPSEYWSSTENQREAILRIGHKLGVDPNNLESWYSISSLMIAKSGGATLLLNIHRGSRFNLFSSVFPDHPWRAWRFKSAKKDYKLMADKEIQDLARFLEGKLEISRPEDWYSITRRDLAQLDLAWLFYREADFLHFLRRAFPAFDFRVELFSWTTHGVTHLHSVLESLFPSGSVRAAEYFKDSTIDPKDLWKSWYIPSYRLLFEYQGPVLYANQLIENRPILKKIENPSLVPLCSRDSLTLVCVPFWWDRKESSLISELWRLRKELFNNGQPLNSFRNSVESFDTIPTTVPLPNINKAYREIWAKSPRFRHLLRLESAAANE